MELLIFRACLNRMSPQRVTFEGLNYICSGRSLCFGNRCAGRKRISINTRTHDLDHCVVDGARTRGVFICVGLLFLGLPRLVSALDFIRFLYVLLAAILLPMAVFLHVVSIRQMALRRRSSSF